MTEVVSCRHRVGGGGFLKKNHASSESSSPGFCRFRLVGSRIGCLFHEIQLEFQEIGRWRYRSPVSLQLFTRTVPANKPTYHSRRPWTVAVACYNPRKPNGTRNTGERKKEDGRRRFEPGLRDPKAKTVSEKVKHGRRE